MAASAIIGGTASELGGGKFGNGAVSAAFVMLYNDLSHPTQASSNGKGWKLRNNLTNAGSGSGYAEELHQEMAYNHKNPIYGPREGHFVEKYGNELGLVLSVGAAVTSGGWSLLLGSSAIGLDLLEPDYYGTVIGTGAMIYKTPTMKVIDVSYGACRTNSTCSDYLDEYLP
jgi:hypothetical protein